MIGLRELQGTYHLDPAHCSIGWVARHAGIAKLRGTFEDFHGWANVNRDEPAQSEMLVTIMASSIYSRDENRDKHLVNEDFLDTERFPTITFVGRDFVIQSDEQVDVTGDLTIRDVTQRVTIPFQFDGASLDVFGNERVGFTGSTPILRSEFGLTWNPTLETGVSSSGTRCCSSSRCRLSRRRWTSMPTGIRWILNRMPRNETPTSRCLVNRLLRHAVLVWTAEVHFLRV